MKRKPELFSENFCSVYTKASVSLNEQKKLFLTEHVIEAIFYLCAGSFINGNVH